MTVIITHRINRIIVNALTDTGTSNSGCILAAYLFGSTVSGSDTPNSDLDLAFLLAALSYKTDPVQAIKLPYLLATRIGMEADYATDVTILNSASLELAYEVITTGVCIYESDANLRLEYEIAVKGMFFDFKPFLYELREKSIAGL